jgi:hypothetical protein
VTGDIETYLSKIFAATLFDQIPKFMEQRFSFHALDSGSFPAFQPLLFLTQHLECWSA